MQNRVSKDREGSSMTTFVAYSERAEIVYIKFLIVHSFVRSFVLGTMHQNQEMKWQWKKYERNDLLEAGQNFHN